MLAEMLCYPYQIPFQSFSTWIIKTPGYDPDVIIYINPIYSPSLVINEEVKSSGRIPAKEEIMDWLREAQ